MRPQQTSNNDIEGIRNAQSAPPSRPTGQNPGTERQSAPIRDPIRPQPEYSPATSPQRKSPKYAWRGFFSVIQLVVGAAVLAFIINQLIFQPYEVFGQSMVPTLQEGDRLIVSKLGKTWATITRGQYLPKRGEIIVFHNPNSPNIQLVKRVVGLPGDRIVVNEGEIIVHTPDDPNGFNFDERFGLNLVTTVGNVDATVPANEIFVVGDNRSPNGSLDSRNELGTVPLDQVVGDLVFRIFPVNEAAAF